MVSRLQPCDALVLMLSILSLDGGDDRVGSRALAAVMTILVHVLPLGCSWKLELCISTAHRACSEYGQGWQLDTFNGTWVVTNLIAKARQALRALKGLVRLQALVRGHAMRKQAAITLRCKQALIRVQARVRAKWVRIALEADSNIPKASSRFLFTAVEVRDGAACVCRGCIGVIGVMESAVVTCVCGGCIGVTGVTDSTVGAIASGGTGVMFSTVKVATFCYDLSSKRR
ncbi:hypothetical protein SSX86_029934 [Deinandra increscens subsp. villosa]|uniref:Uncharacterized protein n=1 Tax=Deinandra increscens subsp. villosa TaxID=3103831 RepID=A0AAP0CCA9_9ASTR